jgi:ribonuclease-3 family protein
MGEKLMALNAFSVRTAFDTGQEERDIEQYSPLELAFLGDAVQEIVVRTLLVETSSEKPSKLHSHSSHLVRAHSQALILDSIDDLLSDSEKDLARRGRNAKSGTRAKNASILDYRKATGLETLLGGLFLKGEDDRIMDLLRTGMERTGLLNEGENK